MDFSFTEDQDALRALAQKIFTDLATHDRLKAVEAEPEWFDRKLWAELAKANLLGIALPEDVGGSGLSLIELCILLEEAGRAVAPLPLVPSLMAASAIAEFGSATQRQRWLTPLASGEAVLTTALVEAGSDDPSQPRVSARRDGSVWRLSGEKICVPAAHVAARVVVPARTGHNLVGVFLLDPKAAGVTLERQTATNGEPQFQLTLADATVANDDVLGDPADGARIVTWLVERMLTGLCALQTGVCDRALRLTAQYTSTREQFGKPLGTFQAVGQRAADAYIDVEAIRWTMWQAAWRLSAGQPASAEVAVAKFWTAEAGHRVTYAAQHLHGGIGLDLDYPVHRYYVWAKTIELSLGSATRQLHRLGQLLAEQPSAG